MEQNKENKIENIAISDEMETSFIDYAMSVIVSRAIPDVRDGLKPVHRRILYAMDGLDMHFNKDFKKSARAVGEVIAKYHPHGDSSVYDALVRLAQPFSLRYPLILGQGNFGSIDGDSPAAMRYTEAKLEKISNLLLNDIKKDTVDFQENYDGSEIEPIVLPSKIPNLLINGSTGIAVGMATSIPPHNLNEVLNATKHLIRNSESEVEELMNYVHAPDFPTGGIIINRNEIKNIYTTGRGRVLLRSKTHFENLESNNPKIIITEIPYMINKSQLIIKIAELVKNKVVDSITEIRDESNRKGIRVVIKLKNNFLPEVELNKLFKLTPLQSSFSVNLLALLNNRPKLMNLKTVLEAFIDYQVEILIRKTKFELKKAKARKHLLEGLQIALDNIERVIEILRNSKTSKNAVANLIAEFNLDEIQSKAILDMRMQRLVGLEREQLLIELKSLIEKIADLEDILASEERRNSEIIKGINEIIDVFGDERRTEISLKHFENISEEDLIPKKNVVITITNKGYIKRLPLESYRPQKRGGLGSKATSIVEEDYLKDIIVANTHTDLLIFSSYGKVYRLRVHNIPERSKTAKGIPIVNLINAEKNEEVNSILSVNEYEDTDLLFITKKGIVKKTSLSEFERINVNGKKALGLKENDSLLGVIKIPNKEIVNIILGNSNGLANRFHSDGLRRMGRTAAGVKGMNVGDGEIVDYSWAYDDSLIFSLSENGFGKLTDLSAYRLTRRGGKGVKTLNTSKAGKLIALSAVSGKEDLLIIKDNGLIIRTSLNDVSSVSRNTKGVIITKLKEGEKIVSATIFKSEDNLNEEIMEKTVEDKILVKENKELVDELELDQENINEEN